MYVKEKGVKISRGQPLFAIYSEELLALQKEYILANAQVKAFPDDSRFKDIEKAAKNKLKLYGLSDKYIKQLSEKTQPDSHITINAETEGMVADVLVQEGQYVSVGGDVMRIENYAHLWAEAEVNSQSASSIKIGQRVQVAVSGYEELLDGKVSFIAPDLESNTQIQIVRVEIANVNNRLQPGVQAVLQFPIGGKVGSLSVPADAVIRDGKGAHVWIDNGKGKFAPRMVETGVENADQVEITDGVTEGERVVVTGAYLLYSEYILKKGANPLAAHNH
jgi:Cu(I)/Ag(I) efflux system membrane fusion protein